MKLITYLFCLVAASCFAQTNKPVTTRGTLNIKYNSRVQTAGGKPKPGVRDQYQINLNYSDSAIFAGNIMYTPIIAGMMDRVSQAASLDYQVDCIVVNPKNPAQTKQVGRLYGVVPISPEGIYKYAAGTLKVDVYPMGMAQGFTSRFVGTAAGKPLVKQDGIINSFKKEALSISKSVQGKTATVVVKKYDKMTFTGHTLGAGPVQYYPESTVNGTLIYDYDRYAWYFQNVTITYPLDGSMKLDKLTGSIRWIEQKPNGNIRDGEYQFDVRVNEPPPNEGNVFAGASSEAAFFETDDNLSCLTGTMKYKDTLSGETVTSSAVAIDLVGNKMTKLQGMNLAKLLIFSCVVPMNSE